jgi:hypothetical protein
MNELTFLDLAILKKIDPSSSVENFGTVINTSFFETANLLGTIKIKGYINIETSIGGISKVTITDAGMGILALAEKKANETIEPLDTALLHALAGGAKDPDALRAALNIRSGDLAYHINKMAVQGLVDYEIHSAKANLMLTESGFNSTGGVKVQGAPAQAQMEKKEMPSSAPEGAIPEKREKKEDGKEDINHILRGVEAEEKKQHEGEKKHRHAHEEKKHHEPPKPEDAKKRRLFSKIEFYLREYWAWILLSIIAVVIFASAVYSTMLKL